MSVWLFANNILCRNVRDFISASGKAKIAIIGPEELPRIYTSLQNCALLFREEIESTPEAILKNAWSEWDNIRSLPASVEDRIALWLKIACKQYGGRQKEIQGTPYKFEETIKKILGV